MLADSVVSRVLQSQNQTLQDAVKRMTTRIRELEAALGSTQSQLTAQPHPLLQESPANRENESLMQLLEGGSLNGASPEEVRDAFGSLSIGEQGQAKFHGQSAGSGVSALVTICELLLICIDSSSNNCCQ